MGESLANKIEYREFPILNPEGDLGYPHRLSFYGWHLQKRFDRLFEGNPSCNERFNPSQNFSLRSDSLLLISAAS
jgi:hypothetical protein